MTSLLQIWSRRWRCLRRPPRRHAPFQAHGPPSHRHVRQSPGRLGRDQRQIPRHEHLPRVRGARGVHDRQLLEAGRLHPAGKVVLRAHQHRIQAGDRYLALGASGPG